MTLSFILLKSQTLESTLKYLTLSFILIFIIHSSSASARQNSIIKDGAELTRISDMFSFTEGPIADKNGNVYFTDQPNNKILKWSAKTGDIEVYLDESLRANGLYIDHQGNLLACADEKNQLISIDPDKNITVLINDFEGKRLNGPNDLWVDPDGGIYFTDPYYQRDYWDHSEKEIDPERVYYFEPGTGSLTVAADDIVKPNGIIGSPDGKYLFVADIGDSKTYRYSINDDHSLTNRTLIAEMGSDGVTLDTKGNLYLTGNGVTVFNSTGEQIEHIEVPEGWTANVTFGGSDKNILFITAMGAVYTLEMNVKGAN